MSVRRGLLVVVVMRGAMGCGSPTLPVAIGLSPASLHASENHISHAAERRVLIVAPLSATRTSAEVGTVAIGDSGVPAGSAATGFNLAALFAERRLMALGWHPVTQDVLARAAHERDAGASELSPGEAALAFGAAASTDLAFVVRSLTTHVDEASPALPCLSGRRLLPYIVTVDAVAVSVATGEVLWSGSATVPSGALLPTPRSARAFHANDPARCASVPDDDPIWTDPDIVAFYCTQRARVVSPFGAGPVPDECSAPTGFRVFVERAVTILVDSFDAASREEVNHAVDGGAPAHGGTWWEH